MACPCVGLRTGRARDAKEGEDEEDAADNAEACREETSGEEQDEDEEDVETAAEEEQDNRARPLVRAGATRLVRSGDWRATDR